MTTWLNASFAMRFRFIGGLTIRFAVSEGRSDHALLLSPWPESLLAFEPLWWRLAERTHLVALDLPGCGHSQHSDSLLSPRAMGEFIVAAADAFGLEHPHVVAPSIGTAAALFAAAHPGRLRSLVVGSGAAAVPLQLSGMVKDIIEAPDLDGFRRTDQRQLVNAALSGISRYTLPEPVRDDYQRLFRPNLRHLTIFNGGGCRSCGPSSRIRPGSPAGHPAWPPAATSMFHQCRASSINAPLMLFEAVPPDGKR